MIGYAVMLCLETWYFQILILIVGLFENPETTLDSLAVCGTILRWVLMYQSSYHLSLIVITEVFFWNGLFSKGLTKRGVHRIE
ncbi:hypothetical protein Hanom_Chr10g00931881 [Helianthus anomalus]